MKVIVMDFILKHWVVTLYTFVSIAIAAVFVTYAQDIGLRVFDFVAQNEEKKLVTYLDQEKAVVLEKVYEMSKAAGLQKSIESRDVAAINKFLGEEQERSELYAFTVVDKNGLAISRVPIGTSLGDNVFLTLPVGRLVLQGIGNTAYGPGRNFPLTLGAGLIIKDEEGENIGAIFGGHWFDDVYAHLFKARYLDDFRNREIIFYSKEDGVLGNSIEDKEARNRVRAYVNNASTLIQEGRSGDLLNINGKDYVITNHLFSGEDDIYGGALLLTPLPLSLFTRSMIASFILACLFLGTLLFFERVSIPQLLRFRKKQLYISLLSLTGIVFISSWVGIYSYGALSTMRLDKPEFTIYNSTVKVRPGAGVYAVGYPQQAAVIIYSGGEPINALEVNMRFDPKLIRVNALSFNRSICEPETIIEQTVDNVKGVISVVCAIVEEVFADPRGIVVDIGFTPIAVGGTSFTFDEGTQVLAADGLGTDVLRSATSAFYRIFDEKDIAGYFSKNTYAIPFSPSHENSAKWYSNKRITITWPEVSNADYLYEFSKNASTTIENPQVTSSHRVTMTAPSDGVYYFKLAARQGETVGLVSTLRIMVDTMPPSVPEIKASNLSVKKNDIVRFELSSDDVLSGLQKNFYIRLGMGVWLPTYSKLYMPFRDIGKQKMGVRAFDNADNYSDAEVIINVGR